MGEGTGRGPPLGPAWQSWLRKALTLKWGMGSVGAGGNRFWQLPTEKRAVDAAPAVRPALQLNGK
jgi:hypothetical protein